MDPSSSRSVRMAVETIRSQIRLGKIKAGAPLPTENSLAELLDLSRGTVRRAIEVLAQSGDITRKPYSRPIVAGTRSETGPFGSQVHVWISHPIADDATLQLLRGVSNGLMGTSFRLVVREPNRFYADFVKSDEREFLTDLLNDDSAFSAIIERDADARNDDLYKMVVEKGKHLVFVDIPPPPGVAADYVGTANISASRRCTEHLLELGHTRIAYVSESATPYTVQERVKGFWRALRIAGLEGSGTVLFGSELEPANISKVPNGGLYGRGISPSAYYNELTQRLVREVLSMDPRPTAIVASCDVLAHWVCAVLEDMGFQVPQNFAVVGFDWLARWDDPSRDVLSSASQDFEGFGYHAAEVLLDRASGEGPTTPRQILLPAPTIVRASTAGNSA